MEAAQFRDAYADVKSLGAELFGISPDDHPRICEFAQHMQVPFPMIGDADHAIGTSFGARWPLVKRYRRVTFVLDEEGVVSRVIEHELRVSRHREEVIEQLQDLKRAREARGAAAPTS